MKKGLKLIVVLLAAALTTGCSGPKYVNDGSNVYHSYWTFSFGTVRHELPEADASSFRKVNSWLGRDKNHVYYEDKLVEGADPATLKAKKKPLCADSKDYYYKGEALHVADMGTFQVLRMDDSHLWAKDRQNIYFDNMTISGADVGTFQVIKPYEAKDRKHVYYFGKPLDGADPSTYTIMDGGYAKDSRHVWYYGKLVEGADAATFRAVGSDGSGMDKNARYKGCSKI